MPHAWIVETDIFRLNKKVRLASTAAERALLTVELNEKKWLLAEIRTEQEKLRDLLALA